MAAEEARKLFVAGLPDTITEDVLRQLFEATGGAVVEVSLPKDRATGRPRGFGFVTMSTSQEAQLARDSLDGTMQAGRAISVRPFQKEPPKHGEGPPNRPDRNANAPDRTIYVGNLPYDTTPEEVEELFTSRNCGPVVRVSLPTDETGRKRGFGFVSMASAEGANAAIEALRGADLRGRNLIINLAYPKGSERPREGGPSGGPGPRPGNFGGGGGGGFGGTSGFSSPGAPSPGFSGGPPRGNSPGRKPGKDRADEKSNKRSGKTFDRERRGGRFDVDDDWDELPPLLPSSPPPLLLPLPLPSYPTPLCPLAARGASCFGIFTTPRPKPLIFSAGSLACASLFRSRPHA